MCTYPLLVKSNFTFFHISQCITLPTQSYLVVYFFCANLLHSLILWLMVSSLLLHSLHLQFCCVLSILALIRLVLTVLFCAAIRRDSVSLFRCPFFSYVQILPCEMLFINRCKCPSNCIPSYFCFLVIVITHLVCHKPTNWYCDNQHSYNIYIYI